MSIVDQKNKYNLSKSFLFLLSGHAGVGKSYTASSLYNILSGLGYKAGIFHLATPVKDTARFMGWDGEKDIKGRALLQCIGQGGRAYDENIWVSKLFTNIEDTDNYPYDAVIIDDWRFVNELAYSKNQPLYNPITIRIVAPDRELLKGTKEYYEISETQLDKFTFDYTITNTINGPEWLTGTLEDILSIEIPLNSVK